jgi:hypothetical protein
MPLATNCNELIIGVLRISPKTIPCWTTRWRKPEISPPIKVKWRSELRVMGDVLAIVDIIKVPYFSNTNDLRYITSWYKPALATR